MTTIDTLQSTVTINAPKSDVWAVLDDFTNIQNWTDQVKTSVQLGDVTEGVGAGRHCELAPFGSTDEYILEYEPQDKMVIELTNIKKLPIKRTVTSFELEAIDANTTRVTMTPRPEIKGGPMSGMVAKRLEKRLPTGLDALLNDLKVAAEKGIEAAA